MHLISGNPKIKFICLFYRLEVTVLEPLRLIIYIIVDFILTTHDAHTGKQESVTRQGHLINALP